MKKLEAFLYNQIKDEKDDNYLRYISTFSSIFESNRLINERKCALLGYFSIINVIKKKNDEKGVEISHIKLLNELMKCVMMSMKDKDKSIIYTAAKCMYNIMIFFKPYVLKNFNDFFDGLLTLVTINEKEVKDIANNFDNTLKGLIYYSFQGLLPEDFNLLEFFKIIILNIKLENPENKCTVVSWINCINQIPGIKLINILYLFLGDLFDMLEINHKNLQEITNDCLENFYAEIEDDFEDLPSNIKIKILEIVIEKCEVNKPEQQNIKLKAFRWASLFSQQYKFFFIRIKNNQKMIQSKKKNNINNDNSTNNINSIATNSTNVNNINDNIQDKEKKEKENNEENDIDDDNNKFPFDLLAKFLKIIFNTLLYSPEIIINKVNENNNNNNIKNNSINNINNNNNNNNDDNKNDLYENINNCINCLLVIFEKYNMNTNNIKLLEKVLMKYINFNNKELLLTVVKWIDKFFNKFGEEAFSTNFNKFIEKFAYIAIYKDEDIFEIGIKTLYNIEKYRKGSMNVIILNVLNKLKRKDNSFAIKRTKEFVKALCRELNVKYVYLTFADVLSQMVRSDFVCKIINILNMLLLTSNDTEELRNLLKNMPNSTNIEDKYFFEKLYKTWCINPVSCLILCLIAEDFELSNHLLIKLGQFKSKLIQENYLEYAQLVQLLETNSFISKKI